MGYLIRLIQLATLSVFAITTATVYADQDLEVVRDKLQNVLSDQIVAFQLYEMDVVGLAEELAVGLATLPFITEEEELIELELSASAVRLRVDGLKLGALKSVGEESVMVELPPEQNFRIGGCSTATEEIVACGTLTIMDGAQTMATSMLIHANHGLSYFEPVNMLLKTDEYPNLHIVYNDADTLPVDFGEDEEPQEEALQEEVSNAQNNQYRVKNVGFGFSAKTVAVENDPDSAFGETAVVLDGDVHFFNLGPGTVWARQEAVFNETSFWYLFQGLSIDSQETAQWSLDLSIKGQEVWVSGGPNSTDSQVLLDAIREPDYYLITPLGATEIHYLYVGISLGNSPGLAGVGAYWRGHREAGYYWGGGPDRNHAVGESRNTTPIRTLWLRQAHELGHLIGGLHGAADRGCSDFFAIFFFREVCGHSVMATGKPTASIGRYRCNSGNVSNPCIAPRFSDLNDTNIVPVIQGVLGP